MFSRLNTFWTYLYAHTHICTQILCMSIRKFGFTFFYKLDVGKYLLANLWKENISKWSKYFFFLNLHGGFWISKKKDFDYSPIKLFFWMF
jgi:hypothetical protein